MTGAFFLLQVAELGGSTTFTKSDIFVKPRNGSATFFSYKGTDGNMDEGYTEHSGCPVIQGEKWITTVWMREGVTREEPWTLFDPNGVRLMEPDEVDDSVVEATVTGEGEVDAAGAAGEGGGGHLDASAIATADNTQVDTGYLHSEL